MVSVPNYLAENKLVKYAVKDLKIGALLIFIGVNLRFAIGNIVHGLIYFDFLQSGNHEHRYEVHVPNLPDMCGDVVMAMVFAFAYLFISSDAIKRIIQGTSDDLSGLNDHDMQWMKRLVEWTRGLFSISIIGFGLYFFSKYFLSIGIETFLDDGEESRAGMHDVASVSYILHTVSLPFVLNIFNSFVKLSSVFIFVTVYCRYLSLSRATSLILYAFFFIRFLFATNMLGFVTEYDLYIGAPILDFLTPIIIIFSMVSIATGL